MRHYTVHLRRPVRTDADLVLIKEGFSWPAFLLSILWGLWHRLWLFSAALVGLQVLVGGVVHVAGLHPGTHLAVDLGIALLAGLFGNDFRRRALASRGFHPETVVAAKDLAAAEKRFLTKRSDIVSALDGKERGGKKMEEGLP